jgi:hypothetical protein
VTHSGPTVTKVTHSGPTVTKVTHSGPTVTKRAAMFIYDTDTKTTAAFTNFSQIAMTDVAYQLLKIHQQLVFQYIATL